MDSTKMWGFLRETKKKAQKAGLDKDTEVCRTGLDEYLTVIFPATHDWIHDKVFADVPGCRKRPDYLSHSLRLIIEFDGLQHYTNPEKIHNDIENTTFYSDHGYKVVRIPYFIQLSKKAIQTLFGVSLDQEMFDEQIPSLGPKGKNTPAFLCYEGVVRMAKDFMDFPEQYKVNLDYLKMQNERIQYLIDYQALETEYAKV